MIPELPKLILDEEQHALIAKLDDVAKSLKPSLFKSIFSSKTKAGIYIYGGVGRDKSLISRFFFRSAPGHKLFIHYQDFMRTLHKALHQQESKHKANAIEVLAKEYAKKASLICLDELEIKDITDAMIIGRLFAELRKRKVYILITTNIAPQDLYKDGLQRELFLPFIDMIIKDFDIFAFKNGNDYRLKQISSSKRVLYPLGQDTKEQIDNIILHLVDTDHYNPTTLHVFGREVTFPKTYKKVLISSFNELCQNNLSYNDYIEICQHFSTIIIENVPILHAENTDEAIRFINLIDNIYFNHNLLFITMAAPPEELYLNGKRSLEFKRTISRLHEMESDNYFNNAKK